MEESFIRVEPKLLNNLYIDKNWSQDICIKKTKELLFYCDIPATQFDLDE